MRSSPTAPMCCSKFWDGQTLKPASIVPILNLSAAPLIRTRRLALLILIAVAACGGNPPTTVPGASASTAVGPTLALTLAQAQQTAGDFLNDWAANNYDAMYALLHVKSQGVTSHADFVSAYA